MTRSLGSAVLELTTDSSKLIKGVDDAEARTTKLEGRFAAAGTAARALGGAVTALAVGALADAAKAAAEDEANVLRLQTAIENSGASWDAESGRIEQRIKKGQQLAFADSEVRDSLADLTIATGSVDEAMKRQTLAMDLARAKNISLEAATKLMGKVTDENVNVFARMGITVRKGADASELFAAVQQKTAGAAERYGQTTEAAMFRISDSLGEFKESIGAALGPAQTYIAMLPGVSTGLTAVGGAAGAALPILQATPGALGKMLAALNPVSLATKAWAVAQAALNLVMSANPIAIVALALAGIAAALKFAYDNSAEFRAVVQQVWAWLQNLLSPLKFVADALGALGRAVGLVPPETEAMKTEVTADFAQMKAGVTHEVAEMKAQVVTFLDEMKQAGVADTNALAADAVLAAMGMSEDVRRAAADMVAGVTGKTAEQREQVIWDMQSMRLQAALRAAGMSEDVVAAVDLMAFQANERTKRLKEQTAQHIDELRERILADRMKFEDAGVSLGQGLIDGLASMEMNLREAGARSSRTISTAVDQNLIISSPSKVGIGQGQQYGEGLALGIESKTGRVGEAAARIVGEALAVVQRGLIEQGRRVMEEQSRFVLGEVSHLPQNFGGTFIGPGGFDASGRIPSETLITGLVGGGIGHVPLGAKPRFWTIVNGQNIPIFHQGGVMPHDGLAMLERGETVTPAGDGHEHPIVINLDGYVIARAMSRPQSREIRLAGKERR